MVLTEKDRKKIKIDTIETCLDAISKFDVFEELELPQSPERAELREMIETILEEKGWFFEFEKDQNNEELDTLICRIYKGVAAS